MIPARTYYKYLGGRITRSWAYTDRFDYGVTPNIFFVQLGHWQWVLRWPGR